MTNTFEDKPNHIWIVVDTEGDSILMDYYFETLSEAITYVSDLLNEECDQSRNKVLGDLDHGQLIDLGWTFLELTKG